MCSTPILLVSFNRPEYVRRVLTVIREHAPRQLFVFQDGAREGNSEDIEQCARVRSVIQEMVDWNCELHTFYSDQNLGCGPGPAAAITWFFEQVDQGIILEDDAVPHPDFFQYASELLEEYKDDSSVYAIGSMKLGQKVYGDGSYFFSKMNHTLCAWATWKRAWQRYDYNLKDFSEQQLNDSLKMYGARLREREYWCERLKEIHKDCLANSSWDQQFWMSIWRYGGKGILPNTNLCTNIGFDSSATHTQSSSNPMANVPTDSILPLKHPSSTRIRKDADLDFQKFYFSPWAYGWKGFINLPFRLNKRLKKFLNHEGSWFKKSDC